MPTWSPPPVPRRLPGWETMFVRVLESHLAMPFGWAISDCLVLPADLCLAMTGVEIFPQDLRRAYSSADTADELLSTLGFSGVEDALKRVFPPIAKARARRGDCGVRQVTVAGKTVTSTFIVAGGGMAVGKGGRGRVTVPVLELAATYAIGAP